MATTTAKLSKELSESLDVLAQSCFDELLSSQLERQHLDLPAFAEAILDSGVKNEEDISDYYEKNVGFFKIDEIVFDADEKIHLPGVESVISSMRNSGFSLIFLVKSTEKKTSVYFGVSDFVGHDDSSKKVATLRAYRSAWEAYFPGIKLEEESKIAETEKIGDFSQLKHIGVLTGIPSLKREENGNLFVQGLERLIRAMRGKTYCWVSIADPIPQDELRRVLSACRSLQADVHRLVKTQFSKSKAKALSQTVGAFGMKGSGESHSRTQNYAEDYQRMAAGAGPVGASIGGAIGTFLGTGIPIPVVGNMLGGMLGSTIGGIAGKTLGVFFDDVGKALTGKTGYSESDTTSSQQAGGAFASASRSITDTTTLGQEVLNRKAEHAEEVLKAYEERLLDGVALGMWNLGHYFCAKNEDVYNQGIGVVQSLFSGMESRYEPPRAIKMSGDFAEILSRFRNVYVRFPKLGKKSEFSDHPLGIFFNGPGTPVNTRELAVATPIATQDIEGVTVSKRPSFGININGQERDEEKSVKPAEILDKGNPTGQKYHLNLENLPKHLAVFGLTGSGKTNTVHMLIRKLWCKKRTIPFLVIEPAKAEYRALSESKYLKDALLVFSAGADTTDVCPLRLNPFDFDPGEDCDARRVHVLTHIDRLKATFNASFPMYASMPYILEEAILEIYRDRGWDLGRSQNKYVDIYKEDFRDYIPTLQDLYNKIDSVIKKKGYFKEQEMNIGAALKARISSLMVGAKGTMFNCKRSVPAEDLFSRPVVIELENMGDDDEKAFLMGLLVSRLYEYRKTKFSPESGNAQPKHLLVIEEAHRLLANIPETAGTMETANVKGKAVSAFVDMLAEIRAMGQSVAVVDQLPSRVSSNIVKGTGTKIVHRLLAKDDRESVGETMGLNEEQIDDLCLLRTGECVVSQDGDRKAYMCKVDKNETHDNRTGGEVSEATKKYKKENKELFASPNPEVNLEDFHFKDGLHKTMQSVGLGDEPAPLMEKVVPAGRFAKEWGKCRADWFGVYWEHICAEIWALHGGDYSRLLKLKKCGNALLNAFTKEDSSKIGLAAENYRKAFGEFYRETKAYWDRLTDSDSIGILAYKHWDLLKILNEKLPNLNDATPEERNRRVATGIERVLSSLAPRGAQLSRGLREQLAGEILDDLPVKIPRKDVWGYIFGKEEYK